MIAAAHDESMSRYIERVRSFPRLTREEEHEVALRVKQGDRVAIEELVNANLRFVVAIALQYRGYGLRLSDLIAEGNLGLMMAVNKFDPDRGTRFVTYAGYWIRAYLLDYIVHSASLVGGGSGPLRTKLFFRLRRERARIANLTQNESERTALLAERMNITPEKAEEFSRRLDAKDVSLDAPIYDDRQTTMLDGLVANDADAESTFIAREQSSRLKTKLGGALAKLDQRERYIVEQRLMRDEDVSLAAIGRKLGVSRERARQLEARARRKLQDELAASALPEAAGF